MIGELIFQTGISMVAGLAAAEASFAWASAPWFGSRRHQIINENKPVGFLAIGRAVAKSLPEKWIEGLEKTWGVRIKERATEAGRPDIETRDIIGLRLVLTVGAFVFGFTWFGPNRFGLAASLIVALFLPGLPERWLAGEARARRRAFTRLLPEFSELAAIGIEAGLSLDRSIDMYCGQFKNPISHCFSRVLDEMALGKSRRRALETAVRENRVDPFTTLVGSILRAEKLGAPLALVLREQARAGRERHEELMRELSATAPVKMLGPIAGFILPALMIVIIGPALLRFL